MSNTKTKKFSYIGELYRQGSSEIELISFCASANDIYSWGGVPAKTERFHGGFQRALGERHKKIKKFFDDGQASPTCIVVAFREGALTMTQLGFPPAWPKKDALNNHPNFVNIGFEFEALDEDSSLEHLRQRVRELLSPRLEDSKTEELVDSTEEEPTDEAYEGSEDDAEEVDEEEESDDSDELDVGQGKLLTFFNFIDSDEQIDAWLRKETARYDELKAKPKLNKKERSFIEFTPTQKLKSLLISLLRPATIVDGQHRVWGAYYSDESPILFNVCAIKDTSWIEQVFQFVVLNKLAKPISTSFLTGLLNTSLTNKEVGEIEDRFEPIGIKNTDRKIVKYLNYESQSPFAGMIAEAGEIAGVDNSGRLSDKGMISLAKRWKSISGNKNSLELEMFLPALGVNTKAEARRKWNRYETWTEYFFAFWQTMKNKYERDGIWIKADKHYLLYIVTMHAMQDLFIENQSEGDTRFEGIEDFVKKVELFFYKVPSTFFQGWEATGLQSGDGPDHIKDAIKELRKGQQLKTVRDKSFLFHKTEKN
jgi:hypothetical protein